MSPDQLGRVRTVLAAAVELPPEGRDAFVAAECSDDAAVYAEVCALLEIHGAAGDFMSQSLPELLGVAGDPPGELKAGTLIKQRYRIERRISQSSFATVYLASDERLAGMRVVVKRLDQLTDVVALQEMFASELQALSRIRHPNVVGISDVGTLDDGIPFLVLEYVPRVTLREMLRGGPLPPSRARAILPGIGRALRAAHTAGVWHLDIKPENVIVSEPGSNEEWVKLIDFGIAWLKSYSGAPRLAGSPSYMAPEQEESPSARSDIYALALVAFELFTGHRPRMGEDIGRQLPASLGEKTIHAIVKGLEPAPERRLAEVGLFVDALSVDVAKRMRGVYASVVAAIATAVVGAGYFWFTHVSSEHRGHEYAKAVPMLASHAAEQHLAFSPDGLELYYTVGEIGRREVYKKKIAGGNEVMIVSHAGDYSRPQVAPDGRSLTFFKRGATKQVIQKQLGDGKEDVLAEGMDWETYSWSADGKRLLLSDITGTLRVLEIRTKALEPLESPHQPDCVPFNPSLSPDGKLLAFACRWAQGSDDLFVNPITRDLKPEGNAHRLTNRKDRIRSVVWSPDSKSIFYVGGPLDTGAVWRVDLENGATPS